jgi:hypothetical protein
MSGWVAGAVVVGSVASGYMQSQAAKSAAQKQADAAARAQGQLLETGEAAADLYAPYSSKGITSLNKLAEDPYFTRQFNNQDLNATLAPGYEFRLGQGQKANLQANNVTGGTVSGNALRSLQDYTQNFASGEYANAFNQYQAQRTNIYNQLKGIADYGLTATTGQANAMIGAGTNIANISSGLGNAQAASQIAQGNAYSNAIGGISNAASYYGMNQAQNPYQNMGIIGNQNTGYTYNQQVGPTETGGNLSSLNIRT